MEEQAVEKLGPFDIRDILSKLPHRYPFILVDRVVEVEKNTSIVAYKNVTMGEPFFQGHFPDYPVMPGVLIVEALAQTAALLVFYSQADDGKNDGRPVLLMGVDKARFRQKVEPGDRLELNVELTSARHRVWKFKCVATVDGKRAATCEIMATLG